MQQYVNILTVNSTMITSVGLRIIHRRGHQPSRGCQYSRDEVPIIRGAPIYDFAKFPEKLHEIERNWNERGRPSCSPLRSADHNIKFQLEIDLIRCNSANKVVPCQGNQTRLHLQCFYLTRIPRG